MLTCVLLSTKPAQVHVVRADDLLVFRQEKINLEQVHSISHRVLKGRQCILCVIYHASTVRPHYRKWLITQQQACVQPILPLATSAEALEAALGEEAPGEEQDD